MRQKLVIDTLKSGGLTGEVYTPAQLDPPALPLGRVDGADVLPGLEIDLNEIFEH